MYRVLLLLFLTSTLIACNIVSDKILIKPDNSILKNDKVYFPTMYKNKEAVLEYSGNSIYTWRFLTTLDRAWIISLERYNHKTNTNPGSVFIIAGIQQQNIDKHNSKKLERPMYWFYEKTTSGEFYVYRYKEKESIRLKSRQELFALANRVFSQGRSAASHMEFLVRDRLDPDYLEFRKKRSHLLEKALKKQKQSQKTNASVVNKKVKSKKNTTEKRTKYKYNNNDSKYGRENSEVLRRSGTDSHLSTRPIKGSTNAGGSTKSKQCRRSASDRIATCRVLSTTYTSTKNYNNVSCDNDKWSVCADELSNSYVYSSFTTYYCDTKKSGGISENKDEVINNICR